MINPLASKFEKLKVKNWSVDFLPIPYWIKEKQGDKFIMIYLNDAYEKEYLIPNGFKKEDYLNNSDNAIWSDKISAAFNDNDLDCYNSKSWIEFTETVKIGNKEVQRKYVKLYILNKENGREYVAGISVDFFEP